jgi:four helix bundle protein
MNKFRFLNWEVYQNSKKLLEFILKLVKKLPREYRFELGSQIVRSVFSIILNIAEGSGKTSDKELNRYIEISLGSVNETLAVLDVFRDNGFITEQEFDEGYKMLYSISNQLGGFKKKLKS